MKAFRGVTFVHGIAIILSLGCDFKTQAYSPRRTRTKDIVRSHSSVPRIPSSTPTSSEGVGKDRREWLVEMSSKMMMTMSPILVPFTAGRPGHAQSTTMMASSTGAVSLTNPLPDIILAQETLGKLLDNWKRATIDCTFADVPRELLEQKNKELLLEKASTFALFDKSVSVETCKTTNRIVRDYLGVTGIGPLVGMDKKLKRGLEFLVDVDDLDVYVSELETFSQAYSRACSLSYTAGVADFDSVNNFSKDEADDGSSNDENSNLNQAKDAIVQAKTSLDIIVRLLQKDGSDVSTSS